MPRIVLDRRAPQHANRPVGLPRCGTRWKLGAIGEDRAPHGPRGGQQEGRAVAAADAWVDDDQAASEQVSATPRRAVPRTWRLSARMPGCSSATAGTSRAVRDI